MRSVRRKTAGFTLIEVLVAVALVGVAIAGVFGGIRSLSRADRNAQEADLLQRLAAQKWREIGAITDPSTADTKGDFTEQGYSDIEWELEVQPSGTTNLDEITVTVSRDEASQSLTGLLFVPPVTGGTATP